MNTMERIQNLSDKECIVDILKTEVQNSHCNDCGKCVFGYEGVTQLSSIFQDMTQKKAKGTDLALVQDLCGMMESQSLCDDGIDIAKAVLQGISLYQKDFEDHISKRSCRAGVCKKFMTYHIIAADCIGCGDCIDACDDDAIMGKKKFVHVIDQEECTQCGNCMEACDEDAIVLAGTIKPRCPQKPIPCKKR